MRYLTLFFFIFLLFGSLQAQENCNNNLDDDGDGYIDCFDSDCPCYAPFVCNNTALQTMLINGVFKLVSVDLQTTTFTDILTFPSYLTNPNALAYNHQDGFYYFMEYGNPHEVYRMNSLLQIQRIGELPSVPNAVYSGDINSAGQYFFNGRDTLYKLDLNTFQLTRNNLILHTSDIAFSTDDRLFAWAESENRLMEIFPQQDSVYLYPNIYPDLGKVGSLFFIESDLLGYGYNASAGSLFQDHLYSFDFSSGGVQTLGIGPSAKFNDGCACDFDVKIYKQASADTITSQSFTYTFTFENNMPYSTYGFFSDALSDGLLWDSTSAVFSGGLNAISDPSFTDGLVESTFEIPPGESSLELQVIVPCGINVIGDYFNQAYFILDSTYSFQYHDTLWSDFEPTQQIEDSTPTYIDVSLSANDTLLANRLELCPKDSGIIELSNYLTPSAQSNNGVWTTALGNVVDSTHLGSILVPNAEPQSYYYTEPSDCGQSVYVIDLSYIELPELSFSQVNAQETDEQFLFVDQALSNGNYQWVINDQVYASEPFISVPNILIDDSVLVCLMYQNINAQSCTDSICVYLQQGITPVYIPSAFTPNKIDPFNAEFKPVFKQNANFEHYTFSIFDRWGQSLFSTSNPEEFWNGDNHAQGMYLWKLNYNFKNQKQVERSGFVMLIR